MSADQIVSLINLITTHGPKIIELVAKIKTDRGEEETLDLLKEAGATFDENIAKAQAALNAE